MSAKNFWEGKKVLITGAHGFLGKSLVPLLTTKSPELLMPHRSECDLRDKNEVDKFVSSSSPDIVIHLAVHGGGIGHMRTHPGEAFYDNIMMDTNIVEACRKYDVGKFVGIGTVCSYPKNTQVPFKEDSLWSGYPEETNAPYGLAKKMMLVQTQAYREQYRMNGIHLLMVNMYGPNDNFNPESSHVIPALIRKFSEAKRDGLKNVCLWGSGRASREFIYVGDAARAIIMATESYDSSEPINIGSGEEIAINNLAKIVADIISYRGEITWDTSKPDGQPKRRLDVSKAKKEFGFVAKTSLESGLKTTIGWYKKKVGKI